MSSIQVKNLINDVYVIMGNVTRDQLPIEQVLLFTKAELSKRAIELQINEQNSLLKSVERSLINERDQLVSIDDFGVPVSVHFVDPSTGIGVPVEMVNFNTLPDWEADGLLRCSIYGTPPRIRFSIMLNQFSGWKLRYWYEPDTEVLVGFNEQVMLNPQFRSLFAYNIAMMCAPYAEVPMDRKAAILEMLGNAIGNSEREGSLENLWYKTINSSKQYGANQRRPFRAGAQRNVRFART